MKKIISALIVITMLCMALVAVVPTFAADAAEVDYSKLDSLIKEFNAYYEEDYTPETWAPLQEKLAAAKEALKATTQAEVNAAFDALDAAKKALKETKATRDLLKAKLDLAEAIIANQKDYTKTSFDALKLAYDTAKAEYDKGTSLSTLLQTPFTALKTALRGMKYETAPLQTILNKANDINKMSDWAANLGFGEDYTKATLDPFRAAIATANTNIKSNDLEKINASIAELEATMAALVKNPAPKSQLDKCAELLDLADVLIATEWPDAAWGMVEMKVAQAKKATEASLVSECVKAASELETALKNLTNKDKPSKEVLPERPVVDTTILKELIAFIDENLVETNYTPESWKILADNYQRAKATIENPRKAENVQSVWAALNDARKKLVEIDPALRPTEAATTPAGGETEEIVEVGCGGVIATTAVVMTSVLALGAAVVAKKRED